MQKKEYSFEFAGRPLVAEFSDLADQTNGSVMVRYGDTVVLGTVVMSKNPKPDIGYFPLTVDYEERFYAAGLILGSRFVRREGRPSEEAILSGRITDRTIRPLFDRNLRNEVQVVITVLSLGDYDPDVLGVIAASLALGTSDVPWDGPVSAVRIGKLKGKNEFETNPTFALRQNDDFETDILACGKDGVINMIEIGAKETGEETVLQGLERAKEEIEKIQIFQKKIISEIGKEKQEIKIETLSSEARDLFKEKFASRLHEYVFTGVPGKARIEESKNEWLAAVSETLPEERTLLAGEYYEEKLDELVHEEAIKKGNRPDGRKLDELRPLYVKAGGVSPVLHGSGIFYRGGTHILSVATLGGPGDSQLIDAMEEQQTQKRFMHHYNFPPFSTGETGRIGSTNRRMIGHGALAEKALAAVIPPKEIFPYTVRVVSEAMASNGSTSMGSVCGGTLALMDAGVPILAPVAGIAMGLMMESHDTYKVLTDIQGPEDHHGDMDFKIAGTRNGVTAVQLDVKINGIPTAILKEALEGARKARLAILDVIEKEIPAPRTELPANAPRITTIKIKKEQIGLVIGSGGKTINEIREKTKTEIDIEEDGTVFITGKGDGPGEAARIIGEMTREYKAGETFEGEVVKITDFGAFVKIGANAEGLVHVSEIAPFRIERVDSVLKAGDKVPVIIKGIDEKERIKLSIKDRDPNFIKKPELNHNAPNKPPYTGHQHGQ
ncbi:MAG: polyribonucleotide nucleotidyltransferase [Patescibacteria group bacterium]|nr:polyribonucleotide nucleotidyltransferase [bacterium]MDZ4241072.1 polyribonucleotide nucleotidyltransferase [Patescibacteria group bacterium]